MARYLETRFAEALAVPLLGGVEVHIVEYHHIDPGDRNDGWRPVTLLINFVDNPDARTTFSAVRHAFTSARCSSHIFDGRDGVARLCRHLEGITFDTADAVFFAGEDADVAPHALQKIVYAVPANSRGLFVLVGHDCRRWKPASGISGFVQGVSHTSPATAMSVFLLLAALSAPHTATCLDHEDVLASLGTAERPAVLVETIWLREQHQLVYPGTGDVLAIRQAAVISCHLIAASLRVTEMCAMMNAIRADADRDCSIGYQAPVDALITPYLHRGIGLMPMICRLPEVDDTEVESAYEVEPRLQQLIDKYPRLFRGKAPIARSEILPGWLQLLEELLQDINRLLSDAEATAFEITQIKEKLGSLRLRFRCPGHGILVAETMNELFVPGSMQKGTVLFASVYPAERLAALVDAARDLSERVCQKCGRLDKAG